MGTGDVLRNRLSVIATGQLKAVLSNGQRYRCGGLENAVRYGEAPVAWGVQMGDFEPIRTQIIFVESGRSESQPYQALGFPKLEVVGSNPTAFTVLIFRTRSDPQVHGEGHFYVPSPPRCIRHSGQMLRSRSLSASSLCPPAEHPDSKVSDCSSGLRTANSLPLGPKNPFRLTHRLGPRAGTNLISNLQNHPELVAWGPHML